MSVFNWREDDAKAVESKVILEFEQIEQFYESFNEYMSLKISPSKNISPSREK